MKNESDIEATTSPREARLAAARRDAEREREEGRDTGNYSTWASHSRSVAK